MRSNIIKNCRPHDQLVSTIDIRPQVTTTNMIESIHALVEQMTGKVDYWKNSNQKQRWVASSLLHIEQRLNRVNGHRYLAELREALQREIEMKAAKGREAVAA